MQNNVNKCLKPIYLWVCLFIVLSVAVLLLILYRQFFTASANMEDFSDYYIDHSEDVIQGEDIKITFFGNTTLLFDDGDTQVLIDGFITRPSIPELLFLRLKPDGDKADHIIEQYGMKDKLEAVFVAHTHHDHVMDAPHFSEAADAVMYGSSSTLNVGRGHRIDESQLSLLEGQNTVEIGDFIVSAIPSIHSEPTAFNDNIGQEIEEPLEQPAHALRYKEGGSFDFYIQHGEKDILVRPSFNYAEGQYDNLDVDLLFLGITGYGKEDVNYRQAFYEETVLETSPETVVPIHWDNFTAPAEEPLEAIFPMADDVSEGLKDLINRTEKDDIDFHIMDYRSDFIAD